MWENIWQKATEKFWEEQYGDAKTALDVKCKDVWELVEKFDSPDENVTREENLTATCVLVLGKRKKN